MAQVKLRTDGGADLQSALIVNAAVGTGLPEDFSANQHSYLAYYRHTADQNANNLPDGWHDMKAYVTNCATTSNHGTFIQNSYGGTPFQMWIPDANDYIYKRYSTTGFTGGEGWKKLSAGYADSAPWTGISGRPTSISSFTNDAGYITGITKATVTAALGYTPPTTNTTYSNATTSASGLMSAADKTKLDGVASGANNYSLPAAATGTLGGVKVGNNITIDASGTISPTKTGVTAALNYTPLSTTGKAASAGSADSAGSVPWTGVTGRPTNVSSFTNDAGYITGITKATVTAALGYTPPTTNTTYSTATTTAAGLVKVGNNITIDSSGAISPTKTGVTAALNYTPLSTTGKAASAGSADSVSWTGVSGRPTNVSSFTNDAGYITGITKATVTAALNYTPLSTTGKAASAGSADSAGSVPWTGVTGRPTNVSSFTNDAGYITGITKATVTAALGYTPPTTNTTYNNATTAAAGLMSATDKSKLDGVATGANNYSLPTASTGTLGGVKVGSNISIDSSGVISPTKTGVTAALGYTPPTTNTTYSAATTSAAGLVKVGSNITIDSSGVISPTKTGVTAALGYTPPTTNTTYSAATTAAAGLMSAADKIKLDGHTHDDRYYTESEVDTKLSGKANSSHNQAWSTITDKTSVQVTFTSNGTSYTYDLVTK